MCDGNHALPRSQSTKAQDMNIRSPVWDCPASCSFQNQARTALDGPKHVTGKPSGCLSLPICQMGRTCSACPAGLI